MHGQSQDQGSDANVGSRTEPAFSQLRSPLPSSKLAGSDQKINAPKNQRPGVKPEVPEVGSTLLAVYETAGEYSAGILLVEAAESKARGCDTCNRGAEYCDSAALIWLGRVAELKLEHDHQPGEALKWAETIDLSSDNILFSEVLDCTLKSEHVPVCRSLLSRLQRITRMLEMSRGSDLTLNWR